MQKTNCPTAYRKELHERILKTSMEEFRSKGIRAVKMDDIAGKLAISKRTLYEIYDNKERLLLEGIRHSEELLNLHMREFAESGNHNVIELLIEFFNIRIKSSSKTNPIFFEELEKYPDITAFFATKHNEQRTRQREFFKRGLDEGVFRSDIDYEFVARIADASMDFVMKEQLYKEYPIGYILHNVTLIYVRGICTEAGIRELDKALSRIECQ